MKCELHNNAISGACAVSSAVIEIVFLFDLRRDNLSSDQTGFGLLQLVGQ